MPDEHLPEITFKAVVLGVVLSMLLAGANAYLGLFAGMTVSASIPAAVISMGVLKLFRRSNILENNIVQTTIVSRRDAVLGDPRGVISGDPVRDHRAQGLVLWMRAVVLIELSQEWRIVGFREDDLDVVHGMEREVEVMVRQNPVAPQPVAAVRAEKLQVELGRERPHGGKRVGDDGE